jgi:deoxyribonuclease V
VYAQLNGRVAVVGVAKKAFTGAFAKKVLRGSSLRPLYVTSVGMQPAQAADLVKRMHGHFRIPTLLKRADALAKTGMTQQLPSWS